MAELGSALQLFLSGSKTIAVSRHPIPMQPKAPKKENQVIPPPQTSVLDNPFAVGAIGAVVVILAGFGSWKLVHSIRTQQQEVLSTPIMTGVPQTFPSPVISANNAPKLTPTPTPTPTPTSETSLNKPIERLKFNPSNTAKVDDTLTDNEVARYTFQGEAGQELTVMLVRGSGVTFQVLTPSEEPLENTVQKVSFYQGILPADGEYKIDLSTLPGITESRYSLYVGLEVIDQPTPPNSSTDIPTEDIPTDIQIPFQ